MTDPLRIRGPFEGELDRLRRLLLEMILVVRNLERVGDLATYIAEGVVFLVEGRSIKHAGGPA